MDGSVIGALAPPCKDDLLFGSGKNWQVNACISTWDAEYAYSSGYRKAACTLAAIVCETHQNMDTLVYPIVYLYRHHIELNLKAITIIAFSLLDKKLTKPEIDALAQHGLQKLWYNLKPLLKPVCQLVQEDTFPLADIDGIESYINQLHEYDPDGQRFRYSTIRQGKRECIKSISSLNKNLRHINIGVFADHMEKLAEYLEGIEMWFNDLLDTKREMERSSF